MKINIENINIIKASGEKAPFNKEMLKQSKMRSVATNKQADKICNEVIDMFVEGGFTRKIHNITFRKLRNYSCPTSALNKLKQAIMELGFVGELLKQKGYFQIIIN